MEAILTGEPIPAERAFQLGLVSRLVEPGQALAAAKALAGAIAANAPLAVWESRAVVLAAASADDDTLKLDIDNGMQTRLFHFGQKDPQGARSWQGWSYARWEISGNTDRQSTFAGANTSLGEVK